MQELIEDKNNNNYPKINNKELKILIKGEDGKFSKEDLKLMIQINAFKDINIKNALEQKDTNYLNNAFRFYELIFTENEKAYIDYYSGNINFLSETPKPKSELTKSEFTEVVKEIELNYDKVFNEYKFNLFYDKLKKYDFKELSRAKDKILMNEEFMPRLNTFFKYL